MEVVAPNMNIPALCQFKPSSVEENKIGVWAKHQIKAETQFGPYEGEKKKVSDTCDPYYSWEIKGPKGRRLFCIDASDPKKSNWMRYIKCARYYEEQNIVAVQHEKQIYYKTIKDINANEELLGWYSAPFDSMGDGSTMCTTEASTSKKRFTCEKGEGTESSELADQEDVKGPKIKPVLGKKSKTFSDPKAACKSDEQHTSQKTAKWSNKDEKSSNKRKRKGADSEDAKVMKKIKKLKTNVGKGAKAKDKKVLGKGKQILISIGAKKKKMQDKKSVKYSLKKIGKITSIKEKVAKHASKMKSVKAVEGVKLSVGKKTAKSKLTKQTGAAGHEKAMAKLGKQVVQLKIPKLSTGTDLEKKGTSKKQLGKAKISSTAGSSGKAAKHKKIAEGDKKSGKIKKQIAKKKTESSTGHPGKIAKQSAKIKTVKQATDSSAKKTAKLKKLKPANVGKFKSQTAKVEVKKPGRKMGKGSAVRKLVNINRKKMFLPTLKSKTKGIGRRTRSNASSFAGKQLTVRKRKIPSHKKKDSASAKLAKKSVDTTDETNETPLSSCSGDEGVTSAVMDDTYRKENEGMQTEKDMEDYPYDHREVAEKITDIIAEEMPYAEEEDSINSNDKLSNNKENDTDSVGSDIIEGVQDVPLNMDINNAKENNSVSDVDDIPDDIVTSTGEDSMNDNMKQCSEVLKDIILDIQNSEKNLAVDSNEQNLIHGDANETVCISVLKENKTEGMTLEVDDVHVEEPREELAMDDLPELDKNVEIGGLYEDCDDDYRMPILERVAADFNVNLFTRGDDTDIRVTQSITSYLNPENTNKEEGITNMDMKTEIYKCQNHITHVDIKKENDNQPTEAPKTIDPPSKCDNITYDEKCDHPVSQCMKAESPNQPNNGSMYFKNKMHANIFVSTQDNQYETEDMCESESQEINHSETNNLRIDEVEPANEHPFNVNEEGDLNSACEEEEPVTPSSNPVLLVNEERDHDGVSEEPTTLSKEHLLTVNKKGDDSVCENKEPAVASIDPALTVDEMENSDEHDIVDESEKEHEVIEEIANNDDVLGIAHTAIDNYSYDNDDDDIDDDENDDGIDENSIQEGDSNSEGMPTNQHPVVIDNVNMHDDSDSKDDMCGDNKDDVFASSGEKTDKDIANDELEENSLDNHSIEKMESKDNNDECTGTKVVNEQSGFDSSEIVVFKKGWSGRHNFPKVYLPVQLDDSGKPIIYSDFREFRIDVNLTNKKVRGKRRKSYYKCQVCPCAVEFQHSLKRHYFNHHVQEKYKSIEPTKRPVKVAHQREKIRTRGTSFDEERRKRAHIFKDKAKVDEERFLSTEMGFQVESKARFRKAFHQETDTDRVFSCKICGKRLKSNKRLSNHMMMSHPQQYKLNCPKCSRHFLCQQSLERHLLLHSGVKPFSCRYCGKAFSTSTNARRHEKLHSGFRPHRCEECKITFIHATELQRHVSSNHGEFKALQSKFRIPVKTLEDDVIELPVHAPGEEHECPLCGKIFYKASSLKRHASHAHKHVQTRMAERKVENQAPDGYIEATDLSDTVPDKISQYLDGKIIPPEDEIGHVPTGVSQIRISNVHHISSFDDYASDEDSTAVGNAEDCESDDSNTSFTHGTEDCNLSGKSPGGQNEPHHIDNLMKNKSIKTNRISHLPEERFTGQSSNHTDHTQTVESIKKQNEIDIRKPPSALTRPPFRGSSGPKDFNPALLKRNKTSEGVSSSSQVMVTKETKECAEQGYSMVSNAKSVPSITQSSRHAGQSLQQFRSHPQNTAIDTKVVSSKMQASIQRVRSIAALKQLQYARAKAAAAQRTVTPKMPTGATSQASSTARPILQPRPIQAAPAVPSTGNVQFSSSTNRSTQQSTKF
uniref:Uncharacterized protein LOC100371678 n=1 Tax=Saccoglossus kowalevskii TaxID=10224 RepID=A0ABM0ME93_SACKO|nr:PREDICTED: uncharacterized protein LOC100371678 [Saccoglossus kowalevskii]